MTASCSFLTANSLVLVALHAAPSVNRVGQLLKVLGSACLFSGNALGLGWHGTATTGGVLGADVATSLYEATTATQAAVFVASLGIIYQSLAAATAPKAAAAPAKQKKA